MKRIFIISGFAVVVAVLIILKLTVLSVKTVNATAPAGAAPIPVECYIARDTAVNYEVETVGTVLAREHVDVVSEISRKVVSILMKEGASVRAGQLLFKLDGADIEAKINKLAIELEYAQANETQRQLAVWPGRRRPEARGQNERGGNGRGGHALEKGSTGGLLLHFSGSWFGR